MPIVIFYIPNLFHWAKLTHSLVHVCVGFAKFVGKRFKFWVLQSNAFGSSFDKANELLLVFVISSADLKPFRFYPLLCCGNVSRRLAETLTDKRGCLLCWLINCSRS